MARNESEDMAVVRRDELKTLVGEIVGETLAKVLPAILAGAARPQETPKPREPDDDVTELLGKIRGLDRPALPARRVRVRSRRTGATFVAVLLSRNGYPETVVRLEEYTEPPGVDVHQSAGGLVPDGMGIKHPTTGRPEPKWQQWKYVRFLQRDLQDFVREADQFDKGMLDLERLGEVLEHVQPEAAE